jgi:hypothetical protein
MLDSADPWSRHRTLKRVGRVSIPFFFLTFAFVLFGQIDMRSRGFYVLVYVWMLFVLVMLTLTHEAKCPRCGKRFTPRGQSFRS